MLKGIILDFDGTIVSLHIDFEKIRKKMLMDALEHHLVFPRKKLPILETLRYIEIRNGKNRFSEIFLSEAREFLKKEEIRGARKSKPLPGSIKLLQELQKMGIRIGIITRNCRETVEIVTNKFDIPYDILLTRDDIEKVKPDKAHIETAVRLLGIKKNEVMMVGDHPMDIKCARSCGVRSCGILSGKTGIRNSLRREGADFVFTSVYDVYRLFHAGRSDQKK